MSQSPPLLTYLDISIWLHLSWYLSLAWPVLMSQYPLLLTYLNVSVWLDHLDVSVSLIADLSWRLTIPYCWPILIILTLHIAVAVSAMGLPCLPLVYVVCYKCFLYLQPATVTVRAREHCSVIVVQASVSVFRESLVWSVTAVPGEPLVTCPIVCPVGSVLTTGTRLSWICGVFSY